MAEGSKFTIKLFFNGEIKNICGKVVYSGGISHEVLDVDTYCISTLDIEQLVKEKGCTSMGYMYYKVPNLELSFGLRRLKNDADIIAMCEWVSKSKFLHVYVDKLREELRNLSLNELCYFTEEEDDALAAENEEVVMEIVSEKSYYGSDEDEIVEKVHRDEFDEEIHPHEQTFEISDGEEDELVTQSLTVALREMVETVENSEESEYANSDDLDSIHSDDKDDLERRKCNSFNTKRDMKHPVFTVGMEFQDSKQFKSAIREYSVRNKKVIDFYTNEKFRVRAMCRAPCKWVCYASSVEPNVNTLKIKTLYDIHSNCIPAYENNNVSANWVASNYFEMIRSNRAIPLNALMDQVRRDYQVGITKSWASRAVRKAISMIDKGYTSQFEELYNYCEEIKRVMPDSSLWLHKDPDYPDEHKFKRLYCCLGPLKKGFTEGCRKFIGIDGCFLKGLYRGHLFAAVGIDANNGMYPFAWAVVETECTSSWTWFLEKLCNDIDQTQPWVFMSDQQKGLINAISRIFSHCEHRFCVRHHHSNFRKDHPGKTLKDLLWDVARASTMSRFESTMNKLKSSKESAHSWVLNHEHPRHWSKSHFETNVKTDILINNHCEIFNAFILQARDKPIIVMLEKIRNLMMVRITRNRDKMQSHPGLLCPRIEKKLKKIIERSSNWSCLWSGRAEYQVSGPHTQYIVDLIDRACSCRMWQLTGIPCKHAAAAILHDYNKVEDYVHVCYHTTTYLKTYENIVRGINGQEMWPKSTCRPLTAPYVELKAGKKQKKRNKKNDEKKTGKLGKIGIVMHCRRCGQRGHNSRNCSGISVDFVPKTKHVAIKTNRTGGVKTYNKSRDRVRGGRGQNTAFDADFNVGSRQVIGENSGTKKQCNRGNAA